MGNLLLGWKFEVRNKSSLVINDEATEILNELVKKVQTNITSYVIDVIGLEEGQYAANFYKWIESEIFLKILNKVNDASKDSVVTLYGIFGSSDDDRSQLEFLVTEPLADSFEAMECLDNEHFFNIQEANYPIKTFIEEEKISSEDLKKFIEKS